MVSREPGKTLKAWPSAQRAARQRARERVLWVKGRCSNVNERIFNVKKRSIRVMERLFFLIKPLLSVIKRLFFVIERLSSVIKPLLFVIERLSSVIKRLFFVIERLSSVIKRLFFVIKRLSSAIKPLFFVIEPSLTVSASEAPAHPPPASAPVVTLTACSRHCSAATVPLGGEPVTNSIVLGSVQPRAVAAAPCT